MNKIKEFIRKILRQEEGAFKLYRLIAIILCTGGIVWSVGFLMTSASILRDTREYKEQIIAIVAVDAEVFEEDATFEYMALKVREYGGEYFVEIFGTKISTVEEIELREMFFHEYEISKELYDKINKYIFINDRFSNDGNEYAEEGDRGELVAVENSGRQALWRFFRAEREILSEIAALLAD
jgi:hypothetical protein